MEALPGIEDYRGGGIVTHIRLGSTELQHSYPTFLPGLAHSLGQLRQLHRETDTRLHSLSSLRSLDLKRRREQEGRVEEKKLAS